MIKIIISFIALVGIYANEATVYNVNMDKKVYYDADRTKNEILHKMSEELELFINSTADETLVNDYKDGKIKLSQEELEISIENQEDQQQNEEITPKEIKNVANDEPSFFASMLEKVGIGSTKKLPKEEISKKIATPDTIDKNISEKTTDSEVIDEK